MKSGQDFIARFSNDLRVRRGALLPHWTLPDATYAVVFRLADSIPRHLLQELEGERRLLLKQIQAEENTHQDYNASIIRMKKLMLEKIERHLDTSYGKCWLRQDKAAQIIANALNWEHNISYNLLVWSIMPNHVHVVVKPHDGHALPFILHSWKSYSSMEINRALHLAGTFWHAESYDHIARDDAEVIHCILYAWQNPEKALLTGRLWRWISPEAEALLKTNNCPL